MINEESLNLKNNDVVEEETLFNQTSVEDISFSEPVKSQEGYQTVFEEQQTGVREEALDFTMPSKEIVEQDVDTEVLFTHGVEDIEHVENPVLSEESLDFAEPVKIEMVKEETLFGDGEDQVVEIDSSLIEDSIIEEEVVEDISFVATPKVVFEDKSFAEKIFEQDAIILERYAELKNLILSYKKVKSRISTNYDSFNQGRLQLFKLSTSGKSLKLYLNLDFNEVESRLKCKDVSDRKCYQEVPTLLRIKSPRAMRNAKYLIGLVAKKYNLVENKKYQPVDAVQLLKDYMNK
ncbi:MAG: hypothetical protein IJW26_01030 [Clostridia bacterium]|nr:hypothetical protein [Clostridia bacterium]